VIFYLNDQQKKLAYKSKEKMEAAKGKVSTEILPAPPFYPAEHYHQKYLLRQHPDVLKKLKEVYLTEEGLRDSTAAALINGYLSGHCTHETLKERISDLKIQMAKKKRLEEIVEGI
jgi:RecG-like helicase